MKLEKFLRLSHDDKLDVTITKGVFIGERTRTEIIVRLFQLDGFYIEVFTLKKNGNLILIKGFEDTDKLYPYLNKIDITGLITNKKQ